VSAPAATPHSPEIPKAERIWLAALFIVLLGLRVVYALNMSFNSDEAQHLHVVWGWANGLLQYRVVFDNHTPLFHILCAPFFRLFGETAMVMIYMRLAMIPLFAGSLWCVKKLGEALHSRRAGLWSALFTGFAPFFFLKTIEFRTDDLWTTAWLATCAIFVCGPLTARRVFFASLALGASFSTSMKTTLLVLALLLAMIVAAIFRWRAGGEISAREIARALAAGLAGLIVIPAAIVAYFAAHSALDALYYGVIQHNIVTADHPHYGFQSKRLWFPVALIVFGFAAREIFRRTPDRAIAFRRAWMLLTAGFFMALLHSYWPMITTQDYPPVVPLFAVALTPGIFALAGMLRTRFPRVTPLALPVALVAIEIALIIHSVRPLRRTSHYLEYLASVLRYTNPADYVMDPKSGAIFRQRPIFMVLENVTRGRLRRGQIQSDVIEKLKTTHTCMASEDRLEGRDLDFVRANYLPFDFKMRVAGQYLKPDPTSGRASIEIQIAAPYVIITPDGPATGTLDGKPYSGKILLEAGPHEFVSDHPQRPHALVWAQAYERGYRPRLSEKPNEE
jgi:hypothetical protein